MNYASDHGGTFPAGQPTPEASLGSLYTNGADAGLLRGKSVPESETKAALENGGELGPVSCGWQYVEGLRLDDDPHLALFWDKAGLGHNGQRLPDGGHIVTYIEGERKYITAAGWPSFLHEQQKLLADRGAAADFHLDATIQIAGQVVRLQLRPVDGYLYARQWSQRGSSGEGIARIDRQPDSVIAGLPIVTSDELRSAKIIVEQEKGLVHFVLKGREILFRNSKFHFEEGTNQTALK